MDSFPTDGTTSAFRRPSDRAPRQGPPSTWSWYRRTNGHRAHWLTHRPGAHGFRGDVPCHHRVRPAGPGKDAGEQAGPAVELAQAVDYAGPRVLAQTP